MENYSSKLLKKICRKAGITIRDEELISSGDHILLGLSGGKDSMIMLEVMAERRAVLPFDFKLTAAHIQMEGIGYKANIDVMQSLCMELDIELIVKNEVIKEEPGKEKSICFLCSWQRRKAIFDLSKELNCNKIAFGHHRYDALETLLINMIYHGSISSMPYELRMFDGRIRLIRPLLNMDENLLNDYAAARYFNTEGMACSHENKNRRIEIRNLISSIEKLHGKGAINMFRSMDKIFEEYLPQKKKERAVPNTPDTAL